MYQPRHVVGGEKWNYARCYVYCSDDSALARWIIPSLGQGIQIDEVVPEKPIFHRHQGIRRVLLGF